MRTRVFATLGSLMLLTVACGGRHPAAFYVVDSQEGRCGAFLTCYDVTISNAGDVSGQAVCSLSQYWTRPGSHPNNNGEAVTSSYVEPGEQETLTLMIVPKDQKGFTRPVANCQPGIPTD